MLCSGTISKYFNGVTKSDNIWTALTNNTFGGKERVAKFCENVGIKAGEISTFIISIILLFIINIIIFDSLYPYYSIYKLLRKNACFECGVKCTKWNQMVKRVVCQTCATVSYFYYNF